MLGILGIPWLVLTLWFDGPSSCSLAGLLAGSFLMRWEFGDGCHLAISIATRKEKGEIYSALRGFFILPAHPREPAPAVARGVT